MRKLAIVATATFLFFISCTKHKTTIPKDTYFDVLANEPSTFNPITSEDGYFSEIEGSVVDGLLTVNPETYEFEPGLAEKWEVSPDGLTFTFHLRPGVQFHDGTPLTAEDVKFSFDVIRDERFKAAHRRPYYENFEGCTIIDPQTVQFKTRKKIFNNLSVVGSGGFMPILPKHFYDNPDKVFDTVIGTGPYKLVEYNRGKNILLERNPNWYGSKTESQKDYFKIPKLYYRFVNEENLRLEMIKKGELDFVNLTSEAYMAKTEGDPWGKTVLKQKVENLTPVETSFVGWNLQHPLFKDKKVRMALALLMNRTMMNQKFRYNMSLLATGPWYQQNPYADPKVEPVLFDPEKAQKLLAEAGFKDSDKNGVLEKVIDGKRMEFHFTLLFANREVEKYFTLYKEDLKKAGIVMDLKILEWNSFVKSLDERKFDAVSLKWSGGSVDYDPMQIWHSTSARPGGSNFVNYKNPEVDKLIDQGRSEMDRQKRIGLLQKVYRMIAEDQPYAFMFNDRFHLYAHTSRVRMKQPTRKYSIGQELWQLEP